ncbi:MAG: TraB/GumN family protein [Bacteroidaceae bacterium]|nr:TraB/GumN family protein [Bacteroidaceae bacterium]
MMKRYFFITIFALVALTADAQFLFRISGNGLSDSSYMLGTIHVLSASLLDSIAQYKEAEARCQQMYVEYIPPTNQQMNADRFFRQNEGKQKAKYPKGKNIFDVIDKESAGILKAKYKEIIPINLDDPKFKDILNWQPADFQSFLSIPLIREFRKKAMKGTMMDFVLMQKAKECGWKVRGLDGENLLPQEILAAHTATPQTIKEQADSLMAFLKGYDERKQKILKGVEGFDGYEEICNYWRAGDFEGFTNYYLPEASKQTGILKDRNEKWLPKMMEAMRDKPTMFVFGSGHLIGEHGIVQKLRNAGYEVEQVK